jgi:hypothetical protein
MAASAADMPLATAAYDGRLPVLVGDIGIALEELDAPAPTLEGMDVFGVLRVTPTWTAGGGVNGRLEKPAHIKRRMKRQTTRNKI